jgi:tetratricopeptide (TPR) repeat protein
MRLEHLVTSLLGTVAFSLFGILQPALDPWNGGRRGGEGILASLLGESRRMFATHYFIKADAYYHKGCYPSIFDTQSANAEAHIAEHAAGGEAHEHEEHSFEGPPRDWIDAFSRHFRPNHHSHLDGTDEDGGVAHDAHAPPGAPAVHAREAGALADPAQDPKHAEAHAQHHDTDRAGPHDHDEDPPERPGAAREILPWLRLSASLDPQRVQTYVVGAFFLRNLGNDDQAERFLREGLRENPSSYDILMELGKLCLEHRKDPSRARNFWEAGLRHWKLQELARPEDQRNLLPYATLLGNLAKLEEAQGQFSKAAEYLTELKVISPNKEGLTRWIEELRVKERPQ